MSIDYSRFTNKSRNAILKAVSLTKQCKYASVEPQVMMVAVLQEGNDMVPFLLNQMDVNKTEFFSAVSDTMRAISHGQSLDPNFTAELLNVLQKAILLSELDNNTVVALEYIFWAFIEVDNPIQQVMTQYGITSAKMKNAVYVFQHGAENQDNRIDL